MARRTRKTTPAEGPAVKPLVPDSRRAWQPFQGENPSGFVRCPIVQGVEAGGLFPVGCYPLRVDSPCDLSTKPSRFGGLHRTSKGLSGPALSPQTRICLARRPNGSSPPW